MNRKIYEFILPQNASAIFYFKNGELINVNDPKRPEPIENYSQWNPENSYIMSKSGSYKLTTLLTRIKNEHISMWLKLAISDVVEMANHQQIDGNIFVVKKKFDNESLCAVFVYNAFGGSLIE